MRSRRLVQRVRSSTITHAGVRVPPNSVVAWLEAIIALSLAAICFAAAPAILAQEKSQPSKTSPQTVDILPSYEGQNVTAIEIAGQPDLRTSQFASDFSQHAGEPFSTEKLNQTVANLKRTGKFDEIQLEVNPEANGVRILLVLEPAYYFGIYLFPGAERFSYSRLVQVTNYPPEAAYNADDIQQSTKKLTAFFQQQGYFLATVEPETRINETHNIVNVIFHVNLNRRSKFGQIDIAGTTPQDAAKLNHDLQTLRARLRGAAIRPGKNYRRKTLTNAAQYLQNKLTKQGYLNARVKLAGAEYNIATNRANIHFNVDTGSVISVKIEGAHLWSWTRKSLLPIYQGIGVDDEVVQEGNQYLVSYFQAKGYFDSKVESRLQESPSGDTVIYQIAKGKKHKVKAVELVGNRSGTTEKLMPFVTVKKARFLSRGKYSESLVRSSARNLTNVYKSEGFSDVKVTPAVVNSGKDVRVTFHIQPGIRDVVNTLHIEGASTLPEAQLAPKGLQLGPGKPYSQRLVQTDRKNILARYLELGYLTATFRETAESVSKKDPHHIDVTYHIYEGPQVFTSDVLTLGRRRTQQRLIDREVASIQPQQPLTETKLLTSESTLYNNPGVFDWAEVDPKRRITTQTKEDVLVKVHEAKRNQITYGFGFELVNRGGNIPSGTVAIPTLPPIGLPSNFTTSEKTYYGPRATFEYTRNNMRGKGESLSLTAFAGRLDQRGGAFYIDPNFLWSKWTSTLALTAEHDGENPIFSSQQEVASEQIQRPLDKAQKDIFFLRYSFSKTDLTNIEIPELVPPEDQHIRLSTVAASFTHDTRDNILDAHKGLLQSEEIDFNSTKLGSSVDFAKLTTQTAYYKTIMHNIVWANSIRIGLAQPFSGSFVPLSEAFFSGGGSTLRGFPLDSAGPQRPVEVCSTGSSTDCTYIQVPSGGNELLILNSEFRIPLPIKKDLGMAIFYDGGNVFPIVGFHDFTSLYSNNVGLGLRYATPVGPIRFDVGRNLNPVPGISATQYFISIGQAF
jgi:outer membrane protein insertion porin family